MARFKSTYLQWSGILLMLLLVLCAEVSGQAVVDTVSTPPSSTKNSTSTMKALFKGPPGRAFLYSLILPGAGQVYNKRYWKLPIVIGAFGVTGYILKDNLETFNRLDRAYRLRVDFGMDTITEFPNLSTAQIDANREIFRKNVQQTYVALGILYFVTAAEAYVDRHLMVFDMSDDLGVELHLGTTPHGIGIVANILPVNPKPKTFNLGLH